MTRVLALAALIFPPGCAKDGGSAVEDEIQKIAEGKNAAVGAAFLLDGRLFKFNDEKQYPLMSVFKIHVAFAALKKMERERADLREKIRISPSMMRQGTYSPMRERHPDGVTLPMSELVRFCVSESDNNACDILIEYAGGIGRVAAEAESLGVTDFALSETEESMHADIEKCYNNTASPSHAVRLLNAIFNEKPLEAPYAGLLKDAMLRAATGKDKIRAGLPPEIPLAHKTGSSDRKADGIKTGDNDAGFFTLPDGRECFIAVFIRDSAETDKTNAKIIADIAKAVYAHAANGGAATQAKRLEGAPGQGGAHP